MKERNQAEHEMNSVKGLAAILGATALIMIALACGNGDKVTPTSEGAPPPVASPTVTVEPAQPLPPPTSPAGTFETLVPSATSTSAPNPIERLALPFPCLAEGQSAYSEGKALDSQSEHAKAIEKMDEVIRLDPQCAVAYSSRGFAALHIGRNEEALRDYNEAIRLAPEAGDLYNSLYNRGGVYSDLGQHQLAIQDYNEAIRLYPGQAWLYDARARTYERMGDQQKAKADIDQACQFDVDGAYCRATERPTPAGQQGLNPLDPSNPVRTILPTRGFFTNSSSGKFNDIDKLMDPASLAVFGILLTLLATSVSLFKGS